MAINRYRLPGVDKKYSRELRNKGFLVIVRTYKTRNEDQEERLEEMTELTDSALIRPVGSMLINLNDPSPSHFLRQGKLEELKAEAEKAGANVLIFDKELTPAQNGNIEKFTKLSVMDRTALILDIFGRRAKSREGKLQVELAQLSYALPRIGGLGGVMSRLGGGIGTRGPGEQELEKDKRKIRTRMKQVKDELEKVKQHRQLIREGRKKKNFFTVALVGYTNAGKSTLLNALTGADSYVEDKLFATLDPVTRVEKLNGRRDVLFIDTVGFLRDLPHTLVESFQATLEEVNHADVLVHVMDVSSPQVQSMKEAVEVVLKEMETEGKPVILALNKADLLEEDAQKYIQSIWPDGVLMSARNKQGLKELASKIEACI